MLIWDKAAIHGSAEVKGPLSERITHTGPLPPCCPELNADEQVHGYIKKNLLANRLFKKKGDLIKMVEDGYQFLKNRPDLVKSFFRNQNVGFSQ